MNEGKTACGYPQELIKDGSKCQRAYLTAADSRQPMTIHKKGIDAERPSQEPTRAKKPSTARVPQAAAVQPVQRIPRVHAAQRLSRTHIAAALGVTLDTLGASAVLEPSRLQVGNSVMSYFCAVEVMPNQKYAAFSEKICDGYVDVRFMAVTGKRYLLDCAGSPANQTWKLHLKGTSIVSTISGTEHPAFVHNATKNGIVEFRLTGSAPSYMVNRCEITTTQ